MHTTIQRLAEEYKFRLKALYGDDLVELVLFGSYARGDFHEESDVDFALVLRNKNRPSAEIFNTSAIASELSLKYGLMISTLYCCKVILRYNGSSFCGMYLILKCFGYGV